METRKYIVSMLLLILFGISVYVYYVAKDDGEPLDIKMAKHEILQEIEHLTHLEETVISYVPKSDVGHLDMLNPDLNKKYQDPKNVIQYLFATAVMDDPHLFMEAFDTETFFQDISVDDKEDRVELIHEMMTRITRDGLLIEVNYLKDSLSMDRKTRNAELILVYSDSHKVLLSVKMEMRSTNHEPGDHMYLVTSSVWSIINDIEKKSK